MATTGQGPSPNPNNATTKDPFTNTFKVKLRRAADYFTANPVEDNPGNPSQKRGRINTGGVVFDVMPELTESRNVEYKTMNPIHMPGQIFVYGSTSSRTYSLSSVKLISRTIEEATRNMQTLWTLRGWTMPYFGKGSSTLNENELTYRRTGQTLDGRRAADRAEDRRLRGQQLLGKPPDVLYLSAYASPPAIITQGKNPARRSFPTNIANVPVVLTSLTIPYTADVDYIPTVHGEPFPRVMIIDMQLQETRAPKEFTDNFSLQKFREGALVGF